VRDPVPEIRAVEAFERISPVYDATRSPVPAATMDRIAADLRSQGVASLLEVGIGTGRIAGPLVERGFVVTGLDGAKGMLARARAKGVARLVRGDAYALPFRDAAVDTTLFVHVLQLLDDPVAAIREGCRVGRLGVTALVQPPIEGAPASGEGGDDDPRRLVLEILAREGHPVPRGTHGPRTAEARILRSIPPDRLEVVSDRTITEPLARRLELIERRASRHFLDVPPELLERATSEARERIGDRTHTYRSVEALATWRRPPAPSAVVR
jgi:ubiquinone/menaquinone biosynthesis C-methylase UbiE